MLKKAEEIYQQRGDLASAQEVNEVLK